MKFNIDLENFFVFRLAKYLYHRFSGKASWRVFHLSPTFSVHGGKSGYWIVSPRMPRKYAKMNSRGDFASHINYDPGPNDYGIKEPEYPMIQDSMNHYPEGANDIYHYHWKYKSTLWGK